MKKYLAIIVLTLFCSHTVLANDIRDFQIAGISLEDNLLDHISEEKIKNNIQYWKEQKSNKKYTEVNLSDYINTEPYDKVTASYKTSDKKYKIMQVEGIIWFDNIAPCLEEKTKIVEELSNLFKENKQKNYRKTVHWADKDSYTYKYEVYFGSQQNDYFDTITADCYDWSEKIEYQDHLRVGITKIEIWKWIDEISKN